MFASKDDRPKPQLISQAQSKKDGDTKHLQIIKFYRARWYIGMPSASYAAGPGSNPGEGDKMTTQIDRFSTFVFFRILRGGRMRKRLRED